MRALITLILIGIGFGLLILENKLGSFNGFDILLIGLAIYNSLKNK